MLRRAAIDEALWRTVLGRYPFLAVLTGEEQDRLRRWAVLFLHEKAVHGASRLEVTEEMRLTVAAQACLLILNLDLDYFRGWVEVIVYPDEFVPEYEYTDENGVVHRTREPMAGESWLQGPVILSWADAARAGGMGGVNVVIHEFAHKIDMLNGDANGFPPLHDDMNRGAWSEAFGAAYKDFCARVDRREYTAIDPYAAESPAEFFAVLSEAFFEIPDVAVREYPEVYRQLVQFYRQDPAGRLAGRIAVA